MWRKAKINNEEKARKGIYYPFQSFYTVDCCTTKVPLLLLGSRRDVQSSKATMSKKVANLA